MITLSELSVSDNLIFEEVVAHLKASPIVDGVAEFGSRTTGRFNISSDYDILILVKAIPAPVFQMVTTINRQLADIILVEVKTADTFLSTTDPPKPMSFEALFVQKMRTADILYDGSGRLKKVKQRVLSEARKVRPSDRQSNSESNGIWFWQGFGLLHLERMAQSQDPVYLTAFDMMLTSCLAGTWRSYFQIRRINWEGEKAAIRYWAEQDREYLDVVRKCIGVNQRNERLTAYRELVKRTLEPIGNAFHKGETAVVLTNQNTAEDIQAVLKYWQTLLNS